MHRIVVNQALMMLRKKRQINETSIDDLLPEFDENSCRIEGGGATFETPEFILQQTETKQKISDLINLLPDKYRNVLVLRDIEELSTAEVAEALELSEANVKVRLHRARSALKKLLEPLIQRESIMKGSQISVRRRIHALMFKLPLMISCVEFEDFILAYLEEELSPKQQLVFELHIKVCRECRGYLKAYRASMDLAKQTLKKEALSEENNLSSVCTPRRFRR